MNKIRHPLVIIFLLVPAVVFFLKTETVGVFSQDRAPIEGPDDHGTSFSASSGAERDPTRSDLGDSTQHSGVTDAMHEADVDGGLRVDDNGELIIEFPNRLLFDYFLAAIGAEDIEQITARATLYINERLDSPAREQAMELFTNYMDYLRARGSLSGHDGSIEGMLMSIKQDQELQRIWLGIEASEAFFSEENRYDNYTIERLSIERDESLSESEKEHRLGELRELTDQDLISSIEQTHAPVRLHTEIQSLREAGADDYTIFEVREQSLGTEAAVRLAELDKQRQEWDNRFELYTSLKESILEQNLSAELTDQEIIHLQTQMFNDQEIRRVQALDRISDGQ